MEDLPLDRITALVPEFAVKDLPLGRTLMMMMLMMMMMMIWTFFESVVINFARKGRCIVYERIVFVYDQARVVLPVTWNLGNLLSLFTADINFQLARVEQGEGPS